MKVIGVASIGLFMIAVSVFVVLDEFDAWLERGRRLARTSHLE